MGGTSSDEEASTIGTSGGKPTPGSDRISALDIQDTMRPINQAVYRQSEKSSASYEPAFVATLGDILAGKHDSDSSKGMDLAESQAQGTLARYSDLFSQVSDHITKIVLGVTMIRPE